jgi:hypothetical protein
MTLERTKNPPPMLANYKLGKLPPKHIVGLPLLTDYTTALPAPPPVVDYGKNIMNLSMMLNDQLGDCTVAAIGSAIESWTSSAQPSEAVLSDAVVLQVYKAVSGYDGTPDTDNGAACADVLRYWYDTPIAGHALSAFASLRPGNHADIMNAIWLFGACYIGVQLPLTAQTGPWDVAEGASILTGNSAAGSWGGHCITIVAYDQQGLTCVTWGALKTMTWRFWDSYCDEAFGILSKDWVETSGNSPSGFDYEKLMADMAALKHGLATVKKL